MIVLLECLILLKSVCSIKVFEFLVVLHATLSPRRRLLILDYRRYVIIRGGWSAQILINILYYIIATSVYTSEYI